MERVDLDLSFNGLIKFAEKALERGDAVECAVNLNDALKRAESKEQRRLVYELFVECYRSSSSVTAIMQAIQKEMEERVDEEFYRFDFAVRKKNYIDEEPEDTDFATIRTYNDIKNLIAERRYDEAMSLIVITPPQPDLCDAIVAALNDAVDFDKKLNLDKYILQIFSLLTAALSKVDVVRLMLEGGAVTHRMMVESASVLISDEDDSNTLCLLGIAFFENNEIGIARRLFRKALSIDPIDEDALYYMSAIGHLWSPDGEEKAKEDYWGRYKEVYKITDPPINLIEKFFRSEHVKLLVSYGNIPMPLAEKEMTELLMQISPKEDIDDDLFRRLSDFFKLAPAACVTVIMDMLGSVANKPKLTELYLHLISSARFNDDFKDRMYGVLISGGYEGKITILTEERAVRFNVTKLHKRVHSLWGLIYKIVLKNAPFMEEYFPIRCGDLAYIVKKLDETIAPDDDDMSFCLALLVINYIKRLHMNIDYIDIIKGFNLKSEDLEEGMLKYNLNSIFIQ